VLQAGEGITLEHSLPIGQVLFAARADHDARVHA
jgi:hypothetical protein